ncbi:hypothetical protein M422DRAFT_31789 [Sphaerobolus stellatus SS14]|uniref:Uncharacterized protein n=1 Tax=Sphaerobolus stellatus (strain SS14) TaxID=990650 RepID=A0A0C9UEP5_SPHS4|nr:hypothetical protein M422DRAFT_31789 [Sphaerobolus stellatus SS14]
MPKCPFYGMCPNALLKGHSCVFERQPGVAKDAMLQATDEDLRAISLKFLIQLPHQHHSTTTGKNPYPELPPLMVSSPGSRHPSSHWTTPTNRISTRQSPRPRPITLTLKIIGTGPITGRMSILPSSM